MMTGRPGGRETGSAGGAPAGILILRLYEQEREGLHWQLRTSSFGAKLHGWLVSTSSAPTSPQAFLTSLLIATVTHHRRRSLSSVLS